tara:strand:- start:821 stop:1000 length:180 start_codon:yes stop_codon:yes gene_type:complete
MEDFIKQSVKEAMIKAGFYDKKNNKINTTNVVNQQLNGFGLTKRGRKGREIKEKTEENK